MPYDSFARSPPALPETKFLSHVRLMVGCKSDPDQTDLHARYANISSCLAVAGRRTAAKGMRTESLHVRKIAVLISDGTQH